MIDPNSINQAAAIILVDGETALMQLRDDIEGISFPGHWGLPGGRVDPSEEPFEAAVRELQEETGYVSQNPFYFMSVVYEVAGGRLVRAFRFVDRYDKKQKIVCNEGQKMEFIDVNKLDNMITIPGQPHAIRLAVNLAKIVF